MKSIVELNENGSYVRIDKSLNKYSDVVLFFEKVEKAKKTIAKIGLPKKQKHNRQHCMPILKQDQQSSEHFIFIAHQLSGA